MTDEQTKTSDPVTAAEIAERLGVPRNRVGQWIHKGYLPQPDWQPRGTSLWAWESLVKCEFLQKRLDQ